MISEEKKKALEHFAEGRKFYKLMKFSEAREAFARALAACPDDGPSHEYLGRCEEYIRNPPPDDWDGVWTMKSK